MEPNDELELIRSELAKEFHNITRKGMDPFGFLLVESRGRAVEISRKSKKNESQWWLEFWEAAEDDSAPPVSEMTVNSVGDTIQAATKWLKFDPFHMTIANR